VNIIECAVLITAAFGLFFMQDVAGPNWPWETTPFNMGFLGAIYLTSFVTIVPAALSNRWSPTRIVLIKVFAFAIIALLVSVLYPSIFRPLWSQWAWWVLYVVIPLNGGVHLWLYRRLPPVDPIRLPAFQRVQLWVLGGLIGLYGLALLIIPATAAGWWPWPINDIHARIYSAIFVAYGVGSVVLARSASSDELRTVGIGHAVFALSAVGGLVLVDMARHAVNWSAAGTWAWIGMFAVMLAGGVSLVVAARGMRQPS
jgi:hypothetical protein